MMKKVELTVKERESFGSPESRRLRRTGWVPGVLYGSGDSKPLSVDERELRKVLSGSRGNIIISLTFEGDKKAHPAILKEFQPDPVGTGLLHVDFLEVRMDQPIEANVIIELVGTPEGVQEGGILDQSLREVSVRCLPADMPEMIEFDISALNIGDSIRVGDLTAPDKTEITTDPEMGVASIITPTVLVEEEAGEELTEEELAAQAAAAEAGEVAGEAPDAAEEAEAGEEQESE
ncbi:MAG: 50S ribosomal protein L25 [Gaiellales bacterium]|nr:MAG: 50S ribosomal protein L25 [Gaiellales bacterium]